MNYIVLDLEWNQASDLKTKLENELLFGIIEIGAVKLDENRKIIDTFHEMIKPQVFKKMHQITGELIHLKMEQLKNCRQFKDVAKDFLDWCGEEYIFCTWGNLDILELQRNIEYYHMKPISEGPIAFYDLQKLFSIAFEDRKSRRSLEYAIDFLKIQKDEAFHRADSDAYYTAKVMECIEDKKVYQNFSFDTYHIPKTKKDEIKVVFDDYEKYISRGFPDKLSALEDEEVVSARCFYCDKLMKKRLDWFTTNNGKHYYLLAQCKKHGFFKGKIRVKKDKNDNVYVIKTIKWISDKEVDTLIEKKKHHKSEKNKSM